MMVPQFLSATWIIFGPRLPSANCQLFHIYKTCNLVHLLPPQTWYSYMQKKNIIETYQDFTTDDAHWTGCIPVLLLDHLRFHTRKCCKNGVYWFSLQSLILSVLGWWLDDLWVTQRSTSFMIWNQEICDFFQNSHLGSIFEEDFYVPCPQGWHCIVLETNPW